MLGTNQAVKYLDEFGRRIRVHYSNKFEGSQVVEHSGLFQHLVLQIIKEPGRKLRFDVAFGVCSNDFNEGVHVLDGLEPAKHVGN